MASDGLDTHMLFLGLTRPSLMFGVSYTFAVLNGMGSLIAFIMTSNFIYLMVTLPLLHGIAYLICLKEPRALELLIIRAQKCTKCRNRMFHKYTNSYDPF